MRQSIFWLGVALAGFALSACGGGYNTVASVPPNCVPEPNTFLVYPANNSTGVPDQLQQVIVASNPAFPANVWNIVLQYNNGGAPFQIGGSAFVTVQPPFPQPNATPPSSLTNPIYQSSNFQQNLLLPPATVVQVFANATNSDCNPAFIGSFSTQ